MGVVLKRTVVGSDDWHFDNLSGSDHQSQGNSHCQSNNNYSLQSDNNSLLDSNNDFQWRRGCRITLITLKICLWILITRVFKWWHLGRVFCCKTVKRRQLAGRCSTQAELLLQRLTALFLFFVRLHYTCFLNIEWLCQWLLHFCVKIVFSSKFV